MTPNCDAHSLRIADVTCRATKRLRDAGVESPARDARLLLAHSLGVPHPSLLDRHGQLTAEQALQFEQLLARRAAREPVSRIKGVREFWGMEFALSPGALDPRPDTETLVEAALAAFPAGAPPQRILDLGTGSGCILCALLHEWPAATGVGVDRSVLAAATARRNAGALGFAARASFVTGDWATALAGRFDVIVSNPPYIASGDLAALEPEVNRYDPAAALDGGVDGLAAYRALAPQLARLLAPGGTAALEVGQRQAREVALLLVDAGLEFRAVRSDLSGTERVVLAGIGLS